MGIGEFRRDVDGTPARQGGIGRQPEFGQRRAQIRPSRRQPGINGDRAPVSGDSAIGVRETPQRVPKIECRRGQFRLQMQCAAKSVGGIGVPSKPMQGVTTIHMTIGQIWRRCDEGIRKFKGCRIGTRLMAQDGEQMHPIHIMRIRGN